MSYRCILNYSISIFLEECNPANPFKMEIKSLGGRADEYVDAAQGIEPGAAYTVLDANYV
jgi:hypothetical protein